ncbi:hypothetical protein C4D60_Mb05t28060 [Musa balbisiana]|uniref:Uncharacterized protein n=1 Tax=Musa balbisiana TaxID=52838 RepID=A0A4S8JZD5_MUSBA|nr:hypothetical protein C4D60_Mb05t28060 [Musa balbisiana]
MRAVRSGGKDPLRVGSGEPVLGVRRQGARSQLPGGATLQVPALPELPVASQWRAEGARLGLTVSVCERCAATASVRGRKEGGDGGEEEEEEDEEDEEEEEEDDDDEGEEDEGDNQVVPWSLTPPPVTSSSSSEGEEESGRMGNGGGLKRMRENADLAVSQDDLACSSSRPSYLASSPAPSPAAAEDEASSFAPAVRPTMDRKRPALLRPAVGLMTPFPSSSDPNRYKNLQG